MVVTGDLTQVDLPAGTRSGLRDAMETLEGLSGLAVARFQNRDVVRHPLVARMLDAYDAREQARKERPKRPEGDGTGK
jgi:phosphate starvation-inducible PhoH-like protein